MKELRCVSHCIYKGNNTISGAKFKVIPALFFLTRLNAFGVRSGVHFTILKRFPKGTTFGAGLGWRKAQIQTKRLNPNKFSRLHFYE